MKLSQLWFLKMHLYLNLYLNLHWNLDLNLHLNLHLYSIFIFWSSSTNLTHLGGALYFLAEETADSSETNSGVNFENMYLCKFVFELGNFDFGNFVFWESSLKLTHLGETKTILYFLPEETAESGGSPSNSFLSNREI